MSYETKALACDPTKLAGLSEKLIVSHYENNYSGAVKRLNAIEDQLAQLDWAGASVFAINGLKREQMVAMNSMLLHEVFFGSLGTSQASSGLAVQIDKDFDGFDKWSAQFAAMGKALGGGSGWVLLTYSPRDGRLINQWAIIDHAHNLAGATPILALDMYEHSYHMDFGAKAAAYVDAFMNNISWAAVERNFMAAKR